MTSKSETSQNEPTVTTRDPTAKMAKDEVAQDAQLGQKPAGEYLEDAKLQSSTTGTTPIVIEEHDLKPETDKEKKPQENLNAPEPGASEKSERLQDTQKQSHKKEELATPESNKKRKLDEISDKPEQGSMSTEPAQDNVEGTQSTESLEPPTKKARIEQEGPENQPKPVTAEE